MEYKIESNDADSILTITYEGDTTYETRLKALAAVVAKVQENSKSYNLLVDTRLINCQMSTIQEYKFGEKLADCVEIRNTRVALLIKETDEQRHFLNTVAVNRGYNQKKFVSFEEATNWLKVG